MRRQYRLEASQTHFAASFKHCHGTGSGLSAVLEVHSNET